MVCDLHQAITLPPPHPGSSTLTLVAMIMVTSSPAGLQYATTLLKPFSLILMPAGPHNPTFNMGDLIFRGVSIAATKNGTGQDLEEAVELCHREGIQSHVKTFEFGQEGMDRLVKEVVTEPGWVGKAVVLME